MTRVAVLRAGYAAAALSFLAFGGSIEAGALFYLALFAAIVAGVLLALCADDLPKYAGLAMLGYVVLMLVVFLAATPITINKGGGYFVNGAPPQLASALLLYLFPVTPVMLAGTMLAGAWERERAPRVLIAGALGGFVVFAILDLVLLPTGSDATAVAASTQQQGALLQALFALAGLCGALGCGWAAWRPQEIA